MSATREVILLAAAILTKSVLAMPHPPSTCRTLSASASASRSSSSSGTPSPEPCVFPFSFDGTEHHACTDDVNNYLFTTSVLTKKKSSLQFDEVGNYWCSVETDSSGRHLVGRFGYCDFDSGCFHEDEGEDIEEGPLSRCSTVPTRGGTRRPEECVFPFFHE